MNTIKKNMILALLALSVLGLTTSLPAFADGASDVQAYCSGCHGLVVNGVEVATGGGRTGVQRTAAEWVTTIEMMYATGMPVLPTDTVIGMANYLASIPPIATTSTSTSSSSSTTVISTTTTSAPPDCPGYWVGNVWICNTTIPTTTTSSTTNTTVTTVATTTTTTGPSGCADANGCDPLGGYCSGCHDGLTVNGVVIGGGARSCAQRTLADWTTTIDRMNGKGCGVPANMVPYIANYLASLGGTTYPPMYCYYTNDGHTVIISYSGTCPIGYTSVTPPSCAGALTMDSSNVWQCATTTTSSTTSTTVTTVATTTTTTRCNTYVNGTTQYPYSGSGSCHSFVNDDGTGLHIVRDQKYCQQHMKHFNSKGNHVHAYPHPMCM